MFKKNKLFLFLFMGMLVYFTACVIQPLFYTVSYKTEYGTAPEKILVEENSKLTAEQLPSLLYEGYTFKGWTVDGTVIAADSYAVKSDVTLVAQWEKIEESDKDEPKEETEEPKEEDPSKDDSKNESSEPENTPPEETVINPFSNIKQVNGMPIISITANYLATSKEDGYQETSVNDFVKLPVAKSVKEQTAGQDWAVEYANAPVPFYKKSTISVMDESGTVTLNEVAGQVKVRGNWTTTYKKKPLRIKFDEKQSMLGLNEGNDFKNWVLLASYKDRSFLRDITGYTLGKLLSPDYYASDFKLVEVYVNGEYFGVYILAEQQEVKKNRISIDDAEDNPAVETGYIIEYDKYYVNEDDDVVFELNHGEVKDRNGEFVSEFNNETQKDIAGYTIKNDLNNVAQRDYIKNYMQTLWDKCYEAVTTKNEDEAKAVIEEYIDVPSLVDTYLLQEIVCDPDLYITSFFMTLDMSASGTKKLTFQAPWDFDSTMGNKKHDANEQGLFAGVVGYDVNYQRKGTGNPWMMLLVNQSWFNDMVKTKWNEVKNTIPPIISNQISTLTNKYATNFENNYKIWPMEPNDEYRPEAAACNTQSAAAGQLGSWLTSRVETLEKGINEFVQKDFSKYESDYITAESTDKGIKIIFTLKDGEDFNYDWSGIRETSTQLKYNFQKEMKQDDGSFEFYFPFVEKDTFYEFTFDGEIKKGDVSNYSIPGFSIKSKYEYRPLDVSVLKDFNENSVTSCTIKKTNEGGILDSYDFITTNNESNSMQQMLNTKIGTTENTSYSEDVMGVWGYKDWSDSTDWGWDSSSCPIRAAQQGNKHSHSTYVVDFSYKITVDGYTWKTVDRWSEEYKFELWQGNNNNDILNLSLFNEGFFAIYNFSNNESTPLIIGDGEYEKDNMSIKLSWREGESIETKEGTISNDTMSISDVELKKVSKE